MATSSPDKLSGLNPPGWFSAVLIGCLIFGAIAWGAPAYVNYILGSFVLSALIGFWAVPQLARLKARQVIREDGPQSHQVKVGTPTMGGVFMVFPAVIFALVITPWNPDLVAAAALSISYGLVGLFDDWKVVTTKPGGKRGISERLKMGLLVLLALLFCAYLAWSGKPTVLLSPNGSPWLDLGLGYWLLALFVLTGTSNAVNFTDGVDGLAAGTGAIACGTLGLVLSGPLAALCCAMAGGALGFLVHNHNKAKVFMGDTGSLALGGLLGAVALLSGALIPLAVVGGIFVAEALSVIIQRYYYKLTKDAEGKGKRLFRMAPLHHHFELGGWAETQVVFRFYLVALGLGGLTMLLKGL
ncbi:MAG: phospho-N-acetylmuramoyl-pentapeptide-transferase [Gloeobacterales cyanobacterium]